VAYRTLHGYVCAAVGESDAVPGVVSLSQSFGSLAHWHPHLHLVVTDGAFRRDGSFVTQTAHDAAVLAELWRRAVLALFVRQDWLEQDAASSMLAWLHSGFSAYVGPAIAAADRAAMLRVTRYGARAPVAESRLRYDAERTEVELASDALAMAVGVDGSLYVTGTSSDYLPGTGSACTFKYSRSTTDVDGDGRPHPDPAWLSWNHPNPCSRATTIAFSLMSAARVTLKVYDLRGARWPRSPTMCGRPARTRFDGTPRPHHAASTSTDCAPGRARRRAGWWSCGEVIPPRRACFRFSSFANSACQFCTGSHPGQGRGAGALPRRVRQPAARLVATAQRGAGGRRGA
jgi:hypothetical protein